MEPGRAPWPAVLVLMTKRGGRSPEDPRKGSAGHVFSAAGRNRTGSRGDWHADAERDGGEYL